MSAPNATPIAVGVTVLVDGVAYTVSSTPWPVVLLRGPDRQLHAVDITDLYRDDRYIVLRDEETRGAHATPREWMLGVLDEKVVERAERLLEDLLEARTGFRSGDPGQPGDGEPRAAYDPALVPRLQDRLETKGAEIGRHATTLKSDWAAYQEHGLIGLVDQRYLRPSLAAERIDRRVRVVICEVLAEFAKRSDGTKKALRLQVAQRLRARHPDERLMPSEKTFRKYLELLDTGGVTTRPASRRQKDALRPETPYGHLHTFRPGQLCLIDTTPLDHFAVCSRTLYVRRLHLTTAMDHYTRCLLAWRLTAGPPTDVDAALLLGDVVRPRERHPDAPEHAQPWLGVPEAITSPIKDGWALTDLACVPLVRPDVMVVDGAWVNRSRAFIDAVRHLRITLQLARPVRPTDKAHQERLYGTLQHYLEHLPGYTGPDLLSRSRRARDDAFYFDFEIGRLFDRDVVPLYHQTPHRGLTLPRIPAVDVTPWQMAEEGIERAGLLFFPPDRSLYYRLLPTEMRVVAHDGVHMFGLRYDDPVLKRFRSRRSTIAGANGKYAIKHDPRNRSAVFLCDPDTGEYHRLGWVADPHGTRPFDDATLEWVKRKIADMGGRLNRPEELERALLDWLDRVEADHARMTEGERRVYARSAARNDAAERDRAAAEPPAPADPLELPDWLDALESPDPVDDGELDEPIGRFAVLD